MRIPVCEPLLDGNEQKYVNDAVSTGWISSTGEYVKKFEEAFSEYSDCKYGIAVTNGTVAIHLALVSLGIGTGDEVIIPSFTMIATAFAVCYTGAMPVFVDADANTWNIDINKIEEKITARTKAIIPVHIFGNPCDMNAINEIAKKHKLFIVEDAAEAHGAMFNGKKVGSFSDIAAFSFFANKNITTGEGGMCVTNSPEYNEKCRYYKNMCFPVGGPRNYIHDDIGFNYRMSNIQAAIGLAQTEKADEYKKLRINNAQLYYSRLKNIPGIVFQQDQLDAENVHWMNAIVIDSKEYGHSRDELINYLKEYDVETRLLFNSMSNQPALKKYGWECDDKYPVTDYLSENGFYLPSASSLKKEEIEYICNLIDDYNKKA